MHALDIPVSSRYPTTDGPIYASKVPTVQKESAASKAYIAPPVERMVEPLNGGLVVWLQVAGSFFLFFQLLAGPLLKSSVIGVITGPRKPSLLSNPIPDS